MNKLCAVTSVLLFASAFGFFLTGIHGASDEAASLSGLYGYKVTTLQILSWGFGAYAYYFVASAAHGLLGTVILNLPAHLNPATTSADADGERSPKEPS